MSKRGLKKWALLLTFWVALRLTSVQADQTITGNLDVTGTTDIYGNTLSLGTRSDSSSIPGFNLGYTDGTTSSLEFDATHADNVWKWQQNGSTALQLQMSLSSGNSLVLYNQASTPVAQITLNPLGTSSFVNSLTVNGTDNEMPSQTLVNSSSILTEGLADSRYASASILEVGTAPDAYRAGSGYTLSFGGGTATGVFSFAEGSGSTASGIYSTAIGSATAAIGPASTALGALTTASGAYSTAMGLYTNAGGNYSTTMGRYTTASGNYSFAQGNFASALGLCSTAMGFYSYANGNFATAIGEASASGQGAVAMGGGAVANGYYCTAFGQSSATGTGATATGLSTVSANYATALGYSTASGGGSTSMGQFSVAQAYNSTVMGRFNVAGGNSSYWVATDPLLEVGNGTDASHPSDALLLDKSGNLTVKTVIMTAPAGDIPMFNPGS